MHDNILYDNPDLVYILPNSSMDSASSIMLYILPVTAVGQFLAALSISYYRTKYQKQDVKIYDIQLRPTSSGNNAESIEHGQINHVIRPNTSIYNKIIFQVSNMMFIALCLFLIFIAFSLDKHEIHFVIKYCHDFAAGIMLSVVIPIIFFVRNKDAISFIKECLLCRR